MQQARFKGVSVTATHPSSSCQSNCGVVAVRSFHCFEASQLFVITVMQSISVGILMCLALTFNSEKGTFHLKSVGLICKCECCVCVYQYVFPRISPACQGENATFHGCISPRVKQFFSVGSSCASLGSCSVERLWCNLVFVK